MKSMLANACNMLTHIAKPLIKHPDAPVQFYHGNSTGKWIISVQKLPDEEKAVVNAR